MTVKTLFILLFFISGDLIAEPIKTNQINIDFGDKRSSIYNSNGDSVLLFITDHHIPINLSFKIADIKSVTLINEAARKGTCADVGRQDKIIAKFKINPKAKLNNIGLRINLPCFADFGNVDLALDLRLEVVTTDNKAYFMSNRVWARYTTSDRTGNY